MVSCLSTCTSKSFSAELLSSRSTSTCTGVWSHSSQGAGLDLVKLHYDLLSPTLQHVQVLLNGSRALRCISHSFSFVSSAYLLRVHSICSSRSLVNMLNKNGPLADPWGTLLATGLQLDCATDHSLCQSSLNFKSCTVKSVKLRKLIWFSFVLAKF